MTDVDPRSWWALGVLVTLGLISFATNLLPPTEEAQLGLAVLQQALFALAGCAGRLRRKSTLPGKNMFGWGISAGFGIYVVNRITGMLSQRIATELLGLEMVKTLLQREGGSAGMLLNSNKPLIFFGIVLLLILGAPLGEELFFRGLLLNLWRERYGTKKAIFFSALTFALLHFYLLQFIPVLIAGILLGLLYAHTKNIMVPIIAHSTVNSLVLLTWLLGL